MPRGLGFLLCDMGSHWTVLSERQHNQISVFKGLLWRLCEYLSRRGRNAEGEIYWEATIESSRGVVVSSTRLVAVRMMTVIRFGTYFWHRAHENCWRIGTESVWEGEKPRFSVLCSWIVPFIEMEKIKKRNRGGRMSLKRCSFEGWRDENGDTV